MNIWTLVVDSNEAYGISEIGDISKFTVVARLSDSHSMWSLYNIPLWWKLSAVNEAYGVALQETDTFADDAPHTYDYPLMDLNRDLETKPNEAYATAVHQSWISHSDHNEHKFIPSIIL